MGVKSEIDAVKKALNDALSKLDSVEKAYEEKKKKNIAALKKAGVALSKISKVAKSKGDAADVADDAKAAEAAIDDVMDSEEKGYNRAERRRGKSHAPSPRGLNLEKSAMMTPTPTCFWPLRPCAKPGPRVMTSWRRFDCGTEQTLLIAPAVSRPGEWFMVMVLLAVAVITGGAFPVWAADSAPANTPLKVNLDVSQSPELASWAQQAKATVEEWHPRISKLLHSDGFTPPAEVTLVFSKDMKGVAHTVGPKITISTEWVRKHPEDTGVVVHELTHVIQSYPRSEAGWLVEGIADYIRLFHYEPAVKLSAIDPARQGYRDGYRTTAIFLAWVEHTHDKAIIQKLNQALRRSEYNYALFKKCTGKSLDRLWADFLEDESARGRWRVVQSRLQAE